MVKTPATYPSRGAWLFHNVTQDFDFWPVLESISITQEHPGMVAAMSCDVVDEAETLTFANEDECWASFRGTRIWAGHITVPGETSLSEFGPRVWRLSGQDYSAKMGHAIVRRRRKRKKEKAKRRVRWLLRVLERRVWDLAGRDLDHIPDVYVEAYDYFGASVADALAHVCDETRSYAYIDLDNVFQMYRTDTVAAPFALDNETPDYVTSFPFREWEYDLDSIDLANAILVEPEKRKHSRWSKDATSIAAYHRHERFISDGNLHRKAQASRVGERALALSKDPEADGRLIVHEPGITAGMSVDIVEGLWDHDFTRFVAAVEVMALDPHDDDGKALLKSALTITTNPRKRRRGRRQDGRDESIDKNSRRRPGQHADVDPYPLDRFQRVVAEPTWAAGGNIVVGTLANPYSARRGVEVDETDMGFSLVSGAAPFRVQSTIGQWYWGYTNPSNPCGGSDNYFAGWLDYEQWWNFTTPAHPGSMAGITVKVQGFAYPPGYTALAGGVAKANGYDVVVLDHAPTDTWQGAVVGHVPTLDGSTWHTIFIPAALVPTAGDRLWLGVRSGWRCDYGTSFCRIAIWPWADGAGNSGRGTALAKDATWAVWSVAGDDMGSIEALDTAPWDGGNAWREAGIEGSPTYGVDGEAYYVSGTALGGRGLYVVGEREDDDEAWGPWSDASWGIRFTFKVDAVGDTGTAGPRHIEIRTTGEGEQVVGVIHLGDSGTAPGISVGGPTTADYAAKTLTTDRWRARFDCRSGTMRGKMWKVADREPTDWDVSVAMAETEDDADRFSLWVRCGQAGGQEVRIFRIEAQADAGDGKRVVREWLGHASGTTNRFLTDHPFREGTLRAFVNGVGTPPASEDGDACEFTLDLRPTAGSVIRATYTVDQGG